MVKGVIEMIPKRTITQEDSIYFGEQELTNLCWVLIRAYRFKNHNNDPKQIVFPTITKVSNTNVKFGGVDEEANTKATDTKTARPRTGKAGS